MLSKVYNSKLLFVFNVVAIAIIFALGFKQFILPQAAEMLYKNEYKKLMFKCDNVMRDHFIAKNKVLTDINDDSVKNLKAAEIGLMECNDYDKLRKKLLNLGLSENKLSQFGLETIEENAKNVRTFVETHQIKY
jgi:hypothetical protein